jgi:hypothetical protein
MTKFFRSFDEVDQLGVQVAAMASLAHRNLCGKRSGNSAEYLRCPFGNRLLTA